MIAMWIAIGICAVFGAWTRDEIRPLFQGEQDSLELLKAQYSFAAPLVWWFRVLVVIVFFGLVACLIAMGLDHVHALPFTSGLGAWAIGVAARMACEPSCDGDDSDDDDDDSGTPMPDPYLVRMKLLSGIA